MLRMSKLTDYGTVVLAYMAQNPQLQYSASELAHEVHLGEATVRKLLKILSKGGITTSVRGAHGGYALARDANDISAAAIIDTLEGPIAITECSGGDTNCGLEELCALSGKWQRISQAIRKSLEQISLADLATPDFQPEIQLDQVFPDRSTAA